MACPCQCGFFTFLFSGIRSVALIIQRPFLPLTLLHNITADQLLDMGFRRDIECILSLLKQQQQQSSPPPSRQTLLFSATIPPSVNEIASLALRPNYKFVDTVGEDAEQTHVHVQQQLMVTTQEAMIRSLFAILDRETSSATTTTTTTAGARNNGYYKIIVFFTTARLTGFMAELFNSVAEETGYRVLEIVSG